MRRRLIILDRDGVINHESDTYVKGPDEWIPIDGSLEAIARLNRNGYSPIVISNQSGIGRGLFTHSDLQKIHAKLRLSLASYGGCIEAILYCPHTPHDNCLCRKPSPYLFNLASYRLGCSLSGAYIVGDTINELIIAHSVGGQGILVKSGKGMRTIEQHPGIINLYPVFPDLAHFVDWLLNGSVMTS